jgi:hypothetical protein
LKAEGSFKITVTEVRGESKKTEKLTSQSCALAFFLRAVLDFIAKN